MGFSPWLSYFGELPYGHDGHDDCCGLVRVSSAMLFRWENCWEIPGTSHGASVREIHRLVNGEKPRYLGDHHTVLVSG